MLLTEEQSAAFLTESYASTRAAVGDQAAMQLLAGFLKEQRVPKPVRTRIVSQLKAGESLRATIRLRIPTGTESEYDAPLAEAVRRGDWVTVRRLVHAFGVADTDLDDYLRMLKMTRPPDS